MHDDSSSTSNNDKHGNPDAVRFHVCTSIPFLIMHSLIKKADPDRHEKFECRSSQLGGKVRIRMQSLIMDRGSFSLSDFCQSQLSFTVVRLSVSEELQLEKSRVGNINAFPAILDFLYSISRNLRKSSFIFSRPLQPGLQLDQIETARPLRQNGREVFMVTEFREQFSFFLKQGKWKKDDVKIRWALRASFLAKRERGEKKLEKSIKFLFAFPLSTFTFPRFPSPLFFLSLSSEH